MRKRISISVIVIGLCGLLLALFQLHQVQEVYEPCAELYDTTVSIAVEVQEDSFLPDVDFSALHQINEQVVGWLYCTDTPINYPIVQHSDNTFFLNHLLDGSEGAYGTLFLDSEASESNKNLVIYGHHMKDGSMFGSLLNYCSQSYYDAHPVLYCITPEQAYEVRIFSAFETTAISAAYNHDFSTGDFGAWLAEMAFQSDIDTKYVPEVEDQVMTLSTCAYSSEDARYVVMGVLKPM